MDEEPGTPDVLQKRSIPADLVAALRAHPQACRAFTDLSRIDTDPFVCWMERSPRAEERRARIEMIIRVIEDAQMRPALCPEED